MAIWNGKLICDKTDRAWKTLGKRYCGVPSSTQIGENVDGKCSKVRPMSTYTKNKKALQIETDWRSVPSQPMGRDERTVSIQCLALGPAIVEMKSLFLLEQWPLCISFIPFQGSQAQQEYELFPASDCPSVKWDNTTHVPHLTFSAMKCPWNPTYSIPRCQETSHALKWGLLQPSGTFSIIVETGFQLLTPTWKIHLSARSKKAPFLHT